jgi:hypothetical protein
MATVWELAQTALNTLGLPVYASSYVADTPGGDFPDTYLVHSVVDVSPVQHADNAEQIRGWLVQVSVYRRAGLVGLPDVIGAMTAAGFTFVAGRELDYDSESRHFGIAFDFELTEDL